MWRTSVLLLGEDDADPYDVSTNEDRVRFLSVMMRQQPDEVSTNLDPKLNSYMVVEYPSRLNFLILARVHTKRARITTNPDRNVQTGHGGTGLVRERHVVSRPVCSQKALFQDTCHRTLTRTTQCCTHTPD